MPLIKGTASVEDSRALTKALKTTRFPASFDRTVTLENTVNRAVLTQWIEQRITKALSFEDEIVASTAVNLFLCDQPDPRQAQVALSGFLGEDGAAVVAAEIWDMVLEAVESPMGIPRTLLEEKKKELSEQQRKNERQLPKPAAVLHHGGSRPVSPPPESSSSTAGGHTSGYDQGVSYSRRGYNDARRDDYRREESGRERYTREYHHARDRPRHESRWREEYRGDEREESGRARRDTYRRRGDSRRDDDRRRRERSRSRERQRSSRHRSRSSSRSRSPSR